MTMTREEAFNDIDNVREVLRHNGLDLAYDVLTIAEQSLKEERKTGRWIHGREIWREHIGDAVIAIGYENWRCSECGALVKDEATKVLWKYCPWCGAKMEGSEEK